MDINPIKTESDYQIALSEIEQLMDADLNTPEGDRLDILTTLVEAYEVRRHPISEPDPIEAIIHQMESQGLTRKDLEAYLGGSVMVSEVLDRKKSLSLQMIRKLQQGLGISADILIRPYPLTM